VPVGMKAVMTESTPGYGPDRGSGGLSVVVVGALATSRLHAIALRTPMNVAAAGYALAIGLAWVATSARPARELSARHLA
jgi:hypothetical protein